MFDDRARRPAGHHVRHRGLHQEERPAQVDRDVLVEQLGSGVQEGAAGGQPGRVHQPVDPAVDADRRLDRGPGLARVADVGLHERGVRAVGAQVRGDLAAGRGVAAGRR